MNVTRERFKGNKDSIKSENISVESLARIADALKDYGVQCFIHMKPEIRQLLTVWQ